MKKRLLRYFKHAAITVAVLVIAIVTFGYTIGAYLNYNQSPSLMNWEGEGPYVFFENDTTLNIQYIRGNMDSGYLVESDSYVINDLPNMNCTHPGDNTNFDFAITPAFKQPALQYNDGEPILAISDLEGNFLCFRDFLLQSGVIDAELNWSFGKGHLVLVGDLVDRGFYSTQLLWFIYKLEREAQSVGGHVHYIIGNHELKSMQGDHSSAALKYFHVAALIGRQQHELYGHESFIGRWMASKNAIEVINGILFVHGGISPSVANSQFSMEEINDVVRANYYNAYFPGPSERPIDPILSYKTGPCWYRGYFKESLNQQQVDDILTRFEVNSVVVGHTIQNKVKVQFEGKVIAVDVAHPEDHQDSWPTRASEALLIQGEKYFRVLADGTLKEL